MKSYDLAMSNLIGHLLYTITNDKVLRLGAFDYKKAGHKCALKAASICKLVSPTIEIHVDVNFFTWFFHKELRNYKRETRLRGFNPVDEALRVVEAQNGYSSGIWEEIYESFYRN